MPLEDDLAFQQPGARPDPKALEPRKRYHEMTPQERQAAWAELRETQRARARQHGAAPVLLGLMTLIAFAVGAGFFHYDLPARGYVAIWVGIGLLGFTVIAFVRNGMGSLAKKREDLGPPGL